MARAQREQHAGGEHGGAIDDVQRGEQRRADVPDDEHAERKLNDKQCAKQERGANNEDVAIGCETLTREMENEQRHHDGADAGVGEIEIDEGVVHFRHQAAVGRACGKVGMARPAPR